MSFEQSNFSIPALPSLKETLTAAALVEVISMRLTDNSVPSEVRDKVRPDVDLLLKLRDVDGEGRVNMSEKSTLGEHGGWPPGPI